MVKEYTTSPETIYPRGNLIGNTFGYLEDTTIFTVVNGTISDSEIVLNDDILNAVKMIPNLENILQILGSQTTNLSDMIIDNILNSVKLASGKTSGNATTQLIQIARRSEKITGNLLPVEITDFNILLSSSRDIYVDGNVTKFNNELLVNSEIIEFMGDNTLNHLFVEVSEDTEYTLSCNIRNSNIPIKLGVKYYDEYKSLIDIHYSEEVISNSNTTVYINSISPEYAKYMSFFIEADEEAEYYLSKLMFNEGKLKKFVSGYESRIIDPIFEGYNTLRISTTKNILQDKNPPDTLTITILDNNDEVLISQTNLEPLLLDISDLDSFKVKLSVNISSNNNPSSISSINIQGM